MSNEKGMFIFSENDRRVLQLTKELEDPNCTEKELREELRNTLILLEQHIGYYDLTINGVPPEDANAEIF